MERGDKEYSGEVWAMSDLPSLVDTSYFEEARYYDVESPPRAAPMTRNQRYKGVVQWRHTIGGEERV